MTAQATPGAEPVLSSVYRIECPFGEGGIVYVYYVDAPEPALIDTGVKPTPEHALAPALRAAGFDLAKVRHVFTTHGHWDHMGGHGELRQRAPQAWVYLHREDQYLLGDKEAHTHGYTTYAARLMQDHAGLEKQIQMLRANIDCPIKVDVLVEDGQVIGLGSGHSVRVVTTPGHSVGSTSYLLEQSGALFTGDSVQGLGSRPGQLPLVFDDSRAYRATIAKVSDLGIEALCMGHAFCGLSPDAERNSVRKGTAARTYLEESGEAAKAIEEAMRSALGGRKTADFFEVARATFASVADQLGTELDSSGLNVRSLATMHAFYRELTGAPLPT